MLYTLRSIVTPQEWAKHLSLERCFEKNMMCVLENIIGLEVI